MYRARKKNRKTDEWGVKYENFPLNSSQESRNMRACGGDLNYLMDSVTCNQLQRHAAIDVLPLLPIPLRLRNAKGCEIHNQRH